MPPPATIPPARRTDLVLRPLGDRGQFVAKDPVSGAYFNLGEQEHFLLEQLDGRRSVSAICQAFEDHFGEPLTGDDLDGFLELAQSQGFLLSPTAAQQGVDTTADLQLAPTHQGEGRRPPRANHPVDEYERFLLTRLDRGEPAEAICREFERQFSEPLPEADLEAFLQLARLQGYLPSAAPALAGAIALAPPPSTIPRIRPSVPPAFAPPPPTAPAAAPRRPDRGWQNLLYWRKNLFDPDRLFNWLAPKIWFVWTRGFVILSLALILVAIGVFWINRHAAMAQFANAWTWQTLILVWLTLFAAVTAHEFAHGLTCKRYGGEVHEVGFLLLFFMPCFYCNVSDAWLIREKSKRLWVTLAGGYCDLCVWALAVLAWRLTLPGTLPNHIAWVTLTVLGGRVFFNFNPLLKLDGYYLLSDAVELPNLQQRAQDYFKAHVRRLLWGASRPRGETRGRFLLVYGALSWIFALVFLSVMLFGILSYLWPKIGWLAVAAVAVLALLTIPNILRGLIKGELMEMLRRRHGWTIAWVIGLLALGGVLLIPIDDRAGGPFQVRAVTRAELRAQVPGFVRTVNFDEGERVAAGAVVLVLEIPDLDSRLQQKRAEVREEQAKLALLEAGVRPEERREQRQRVTRGEKWRDLAAVDLERARQALGNELAKLDEQIAQSRKDVNFAANSLDRARKLQKSESVTEEELDAAERKHAAARSELAQLEAQRRARAALGATEAEAELGKRERELAEARATLALMDAGPRSEELDAQRAKIVRLQEEQHYLETLEKRVTITAPVGGLVSTPRMKEKIGQYVHEGDLLCQIEEPAVMEAEITLSEQDVPRVLPGQEVKLTARSLPFETFKTRLERVAPSAASRPEAPGAAPTARGETPGSVIVYCRVEQTESNLRTGMTGYARVYCGQRRIGQIAGERVLRYVRTEFWWS